MFLKTPLLVYTNTEFKTYLQSLKKCARKNYKASKGEVWEIEYDPSLMREYMSLWKRQTVFGSHPSWGKWPPERIDALETKRLFTNGKAIQIIEKNGDFAYAHPVLYDKKEPQAKQMWFGLIKWCCEGDVNFLDLGGGQYGSWNDILKTRGNERHRYKWQYVPKWVKETEQPDYYRFDCKCGYRTLVLKGEACSHCHCSSR